MEARVEYIQISILDILRLAISIFSGLDAQTSATQGQRRSMCYIVYFSTAQR